MSERRSEYRIGVGASSLLMIFVVLSLTTLGVLSYSGAQADLRLTQARQTRVEAYCEAAARAQEAIASLDEAYALSSGDEAAFRQAAEALSGGGLSVALDADGAVRVGVEMGGEQRLEVVMTLGADGPHVASHRIVNLGEWTPDTALDLAEVGE